MVDSEQIVDRRMTNVYQDAVRLLLLINAVAEPITAPDKDEAPPDAVAVLHSQVLLQKLDFWLRNPDYLADELISRFEREGNFEDLELARSILESEEPEVRSYPMLRYLFGAYEPLDEALAVLRTPSLVIRRKQGISGRTRQHDYYLTALGQTTAQNIITTAPVFSYYVERSALVADLAAGRRGSALRDIQYLQPEYADATLGNQIAGITNRARQRLREALVAEESREQQ